MVVSHQDEEGLAIARSVRRGARTGPATLGRQPDSLAGPGARQGAQAAMRISQSPKMLGLVTPRVRRRRCVGGAE